MSGLATRALRLFEPERAHALALLALKTGVATPRRPYRSPTLRTRFAGLELPNPLGLAAGFDKNAVALGPLLAAGFGFVEVGAVTPRPQPGNPRPRVFRLTEDRAVINRFGFNNDGMEAVAQRLARRPKTGIVGLNLGANKDSADRAADFGLVLSRCGAHVDFATVNVSSPNTERLRDLQGAEALRAVLDVCQAANAALAQPLPLFLKISPDLEPGEIDAVVRVAEEARLAGLIATNTTVARPPLLSPHGGERGGLSGAPLRDRATAVLAAFRARSDLPLIGVGGIASGADALARLQAGAGALQLYSALVFEGLGLVRRILTTLDRDIAAARPASLAPPSDR